MSIVPSFYLDNPVARDWIKSSHRRGSVHNILIPLYGQSYNLTPSFYLFFEYFGLLEIGLKVTHTDSPFKEIKSRERAESEKEQIGVCFDGDDNYRGIFHDIQSSVGQQLWEKRTRILEKIKEAGAGHCEVYKKLFEPFIDQIYSDYAEFVTYASLYLAWDCFCSIQLSGITLALLREAQLGVWNQIREQKDTLLPLGKITGGLVGYSLKSWLKDMVDSEGITLSILEGVIFLTYDSAKIIEGRIFHANQIIMQLESALRISIPRKSGRVICLSRPPEIELIKIVESGPVVYL